MHLAHDTESVRCERDTCTEPVTVASTVAISHASIETSRSVATANGHGSGDASHSIAGSGGDDVSVSIPVAYSCGDAVNNGKHVGQHSTAIERARGSTGRRCRRVRR